MRFFRYLRVSGVASVLLLLLGFSFANASENLKVSPQYIIVDNYSGVSVGDRQWFYSCIGTDRGRMGDSWNSVNLEGGQAQVTVTSGWAGVWTSLMHTDAERKNATDENERGKHVLKPSQLLGPYIKTQFQPRITGIEIDLADGTGNFRVELKDPNQNFIYNSNNINLSGGQRTISLSVEPDKIAPGQDLGLLNWLIDGPGSATVKQVRLKIESPSYTVTEAVFLFSYGHLSQCYDADFGMVRDRACWPVKDFVAVPCIGTFALATVVAKDLGYVDAAVAQTIVQTTRDALLTLAQKNETCHGVFPHFVKFDSNANYFKIVPPYLKYKGSEWSSVDTVIGVTAAILACQAMGEDTSQLENLLKNIDWDDLTDHGSHSIGHGYSYDRVKLPNTWDTFGAETFLMAVAYAAVRGQLPQIDNYSTPPTWNGSGFNDELAALFFPMRGKDAWGNNWIQYRLKAYERQINYFSTHAYGSLGLFGLSAGEVPEPWAVAEDQVYQSFGVGGHNNEANDGTSLVNYAVITPHYAAMISTEHTNNLQQFFNYLITTKRIFTPLNNVESFGFDNTDTLHWNSLKGSWNLSLQCLGAARALSGNYFLPYRALKSNTFLKQGFQKVFTNYHTIPLDLLLLD